MPDPIDELESFSIPGPAMNPMPAADVRRRGDRIRRRNNALATIGGVAAVALIATPLALVLDHGSQQDSAPAPATQPPGGWTQTVPADFDLGALPADATFRFTVRKDDSVVDDITLCGKPAFSTRSNDPAGPAVDAQGATYGEPGSDGGAGRTLAVYKNQTAAQAALNGLRQAVVDCPRQEQPGNGLPLVNDVVDTGVPGAEDALVYTNQAKDGTLLSDLTAVEVVRVGNALYLGTAFSSAGGPQASGTVQGLIDDSAPVVGQMCTFSVEGCGAPDASETAAVDQGGLSGSIPDDFPLEQGLPTDAVQGQPTMGLEGPSHRLDVGPYHVDNSLQACGTGPAGLPEPTDSLYAGYRDLSSGTLRQLMTFGSQADAQAYADAVGGVFAGCPEETDGQGVRSVYRFTTEPDHGDYAASAVLRHEVGGQPGPGARVVQVVRVGQAVLLTVVNDEAAQVADDAAAADLTTQYLQSSQYVIDAMAG